MKMKELRSRNRILSRPWITFVAILIMSLFTYSRSLLSIKQLVWLIISLSAFNYITSIARYYNFEYDAKLILIRNSWAPFIKGYLEVEDIEKVELTVETNIGFAVLFSLNTGRKKLYGIEAKKEEIDEMIEFIQKHIELIRHEK